jgi:hypothetical protein
MQRRNFILIASGGALALAVPAIYYLQGDIKYDKALENPQLLAQIWDAKMMKEIGQSYLKQFPREANKNTLVSRILEDVEATNQLKLVNQKTQQDFKNRQTVLVDGWILSKTEARQCALFSLTQLK